MLDLNVVLGSKEDSYLRSSLKDVTYSTSIIYIDINSPLQRAFIEEHNPLLKMATQK